MRLVFAPHRKGGLARAWPFVGLGLVLIGAGAFAVSRLPPKWLPPCGFHVMTGHPCPSCGGTRMALALLHGRGLDALAMNPLFTIFLAGLGLWFLTGLVARLAGRDFAIDIGAREEKWLWLFLLAAFLANWAYLWRVGV